MIKEEIVITFDTTNHAIEGESVVLEQGFSLAVMPLPSVIGAGCGICLRCSPQDITAITQTLTTNGVVWSGLYKRTVEQGRSRYTAYKEENNG